MLATIDHDFHRKRRSVLNPYFSQQNVRRLEPIINDTLAALLHRMNGWAKAGAPIQMNIAFRAATKDIIQAYAFGEGQKCLDMEDCNIAFFGIVTPQRVVHLGTYIYWLAYTMAHLPPSITIALIPRVAVFARFVEVGSSLPWVGTVWLTVRRTSQLKSNKLRLQKRVPRDEPYSMKSFKVTFLSQKRKPSD